MSSKPRQKIGSINFQDAGYHEKLGEEYARDVAREIGESNGYAKAGPADAFIKYEGNFVPRHPRLAVQADGPELRYDTDIVSVEDVRKAIRTALDENQIMDGDIEGLLEET